LTLKKIKKRKDFLDFVDFNKPLYKREPLISTKETRLVN